MGKNDTSKKASQKAAEEKVEKLNSYAMNVGRIKTDIKQFDPENPREYVFGSLRYLNGGSHDSYKDILIGLFLPAGTCASLNINKGALIQFAGTGLSIDENMPPSHKKDKNGEFMYEYSEQTGEDEPVLLPVHSVDGLVVSSFDKVASARQRVEIAQPTKAAPEGILAAAARMGEKLMAWATGV